MIRFIDIAARTDLEAAAPDPRWAVISIGNPGEDPVRIRAGFAAVLRLTFSAPGASAASCFEFDDRCAEAAVAFLAQVSAETNIHGLVCQCPTGTKRAAAMAVFAARMLNAQIVDRLHLDHFDRDMVARLDRVYRRALARNGKGSVPADFRAPQIVLPAVAHDPATLELSVADLR